MYIILLKNKEAGIQCDNCKKKDNIISGLKEKIYGKYACIT